MIYIFVILQTYLRFIRVHALVNFLSPVDAFLGRSEIFDLELASVALLGVGWRGGFSSHKCYPLSSVSDIYLLVVFLQGAFSKTLALQKNLERYDL